MKKKTDKMAKDRTERHLTRENKLNTQTQQRETERAEFRRKQKQKKISRKPALTAKWIDQIDRRGNKRSPSRILFSGFRIPFLEKKKTFFFW